MTFLMEKIGGSMGPIYRTIFTKMYRTIRNDDIITAELFVSALQSSVTGLMDLGGAQIDDKTLLDTLYPATEAFKK